MEPLNNDVVEMTSTVYQFRGDNYPSAYAAECAQREWFKREAEKKKQELEKTEACKALNSLQGTVIDTYRGEFFFQATTDQTNKETVALIARVLDMNKDQLVTDYPHKLVKIKPTQWHLLRFDFIDDYPYMDIESTDEIIQEQVDKIKKRADRMPEVIKEQFLKKLFQTLRMEEIKST